MRVRKIFAFWAAFIFMLVLASCQDKSPVLPAQLKEFGRLELSLNRATMPQEVQLITLTLSRSGFITIVRDFPVHETSVTARIDSLEAGEWRLQAEAKDSTGRVIYGGWTYVLIEAGQVTRALLQLRPTTGSLEVTIIWPGSTLVIFHDFDDGQLPNWGGSAAIANQNGVVKFTTTDPISIKWEIFDHGFPGQFTKGVFETDIKFGNESHSIGLNGHSASDLWDINWGPYAIFNQGNILYHQPNGVIVPTGYDYTPGEWYHVRIVFDNKLGTRGRYQLYIRKLATDGSGFLVGEFDYLASNGRLADIVQFTFIGNTLDKVASTSFYLDNVRLEVE